MVVAKSCGNNISILDIIKVAMKEYDLTFEQVKKIIKQPEYPAGLRDEFAKAAIAGVTMNSSNVDIVAKLAYRLADAMLEERKNEN